MTNFIHHTAIIENEVILGENNYIDAYSIIRGPIKIGNNNKIYPFTTIGTIGQNSKNPFYDITNKFIEIGDNNIIREHTSIQKPCFSDLTKIGSSNFIMHGTHIPHDATIQDEVIITPNTMIAGSAKILRGANIGMNCSIHQNMVIGHYSMVAMGSSVVKNVKPFCKYIPNKQLTVNVYAIEKFGFIEHLEEINDYIFNDYISKNSKIYCIINEYDYFCKSNKQYLTMKIYPYKNYNEYISCQLQHNKTRERTINRSYDVYIDLIKSHFVTAKKILSVGSRDVSEVNSLKKSGYDAIGIDLYTTDENLVKIVDMHEIDNHFTENQFDIVFSCHSLEHSYDPVKVLKSFRKVSKEGALIILPDGITPNQKDPVIFDFMSKSQKPVPSQEIESEFSSLIGHKVKLSYMSYMPLPSDGYWFIFEWNK